MGVGRDLLSDARRPGRISIRALTPNRGENVTSSRRNRRTRSRDAASDAHVASKGRSQEKGGCKKGGAVRIRQHSNRPVCLEATVLPDELSRSPPGRC